MISRFLYVCAIAVLGLPIAYFAVTSGDRIVWLIAGVIYVTVAGLIPQFVAGGQVRREFWLLLLDALAVYAVTLVYLISAPMLALSVVA